MEIDIRDSGGNAYVIIGAVRSVLKHTHDKEEIDKIIEDMMSGDYDELLDIAEEYVDIVGRDE